MTSTPPLHRILGIRFIHSDTEFAVVGSFLYLLLNNFKIDQ